MCDLQVTVWKWPLDHPIAGLPYIGGSHWGLKIGDMYFEINAQNKSSNGKAWKDLISTEQLCHPEEPDSKWPVGKWHFNGSVSEAYAYLMNICPRGGHYDIITHNCQHFCKEFCVLLGLEAPCLNIWTGLVASFFELTTSVT